MQVWISCPRGGLIENLPTFSDKRLATIEKVISSRIEDVDRFYPWPALKESFSQDLQAVWNEQKRRRVHCK